MQARIRSIIKNGNEEKEKKAPQFNSINALGVLCFLILNLVKFFYFFGRSWIEFLKSCWFFCVWFPLFLGSEVLITISHKLSSVIWIRIECDVTKSKFNDMEKSFVLSSIQRMWNKMFAHTYIVLVFFLFSNS